MRVSVIIGLLVAGLAAPAAAEGSLGLNVAAASVAAEAGEALTLRSEISLDVAVTGFHGLQLDLDLADFDGRQMGTVAGHIYLAPQADRKYGFFASYGDFNTLSAYSGQAGIEALWHGDDTTLEGRAGVGLYMPGEVDFIFAGLGAERALGDRLGLSADAMLAHIDELAIEGVLYELGLGATYDLPGSIFRLETRLAGFGMQGAGHDVSLSLGLTATLGGGSGARRPVSKRLFGRQDAIDVLARLGRIGPNGGL